MKMSVVRTMKFRLCLFLSLSIALPTSLWAQQKTGPCNIVVPGGMTNTITCTGAWIPNPPAAPFYWCSCTGSVTITVQQTKCASTNSVPCSEQPNDLIVTYAGIGTAPNGSCNGWNPFNQCSAGCVQDLTTRVATPGGTQC